MRIPVVPPGYRQKIQRRQGLTPTTTYIYKLIILFIIGGGVIVTKEIFYFFWGVLRFVFKVQRNF
jgi:hypothetical protein